MKIKYIQKEIIEVSKFDDLSKNDHRQKYYYKCDECGKEISNKASVCIHCGNPIYSEEHTNVVLLERSWVDLDEKEKKRLFCRF